jgi:hypothetical protein
VACFNQFEADFATFLDRYLSASRSVRVYYPDFVARVVQEGKETMWVLERASGSARMRVWAWQSTL